MTAQQRTSSGGRAVSMLARTAICMRVRLRARMLDGVGGWGVIGSMLCLSPAPTAAVLPKWRLRLWQQRLRRHGWCPGVEPVSRPG